MEIFQIIVGVAGGVVTIWGAVKVITALVKWLRSWKLLKRRDFEALKKIETEHQKCEAKKERLRKRDGPIGRDVRAYLQNPQSDEPKVDTEFSVFDTFKNRK